MAYRRLHRVAFALSAFGRATSASLGLATIALTALTVAGCKGESDEPRPSRGQEERTIVTLQSYVYATPDESGFKIAERIRDQVKSAFGAIRSLRVTGSNKEVANTAGEHYYKEPLILLFRDGGESLVFRVWFRFTDEVFAPEGLPRGAPILVGGLHRQEEKDFTQIVTVCTPNTAREREYRGRLQAVFDGSLASCQDAILAEQASVDAARVRLDDPESEIVPEEFDRLYVPVVARLLSRKASQMGSYPRFEAVVPQSGKVVAAVASPGAGRARAAPGEAAVGSLFDDGDGPKVARQDPIIVPSEGVAEAPGGQRERRRDDKDDDDDEAAANHAPDPQAEVPVVVAGSPKGPSGAQPWRNQGDHSWDWEDFADSKYWVLWLAVFALYPLLKRKPGSGA